MPETVWVVALEPFRENSQLLTVCSGELAAQWLVLAGIIDDAEQRAENFDADDIDITLDFMSEATRYSWQGHRTYSITELVVEA